jgi:hypothetical protein
MELKVITKAQNVSFAKVQAQNQADHKESVPEGRADNSAFYVEVIGKLLKRISRARPQF